MNWAAFFAILAVIAAIVSHFTFWSTTTVYEDSVEAVAASAGLWRGCANIGGIFSGCDSTDWGESASLDASIVLFLLGTIVFGLVAALAYVKGVPKGWLIALSILAWLHFVVPVVLWPWKVMPVIEGRFDGAPDIQTSQDVGYWFAVGAAGLGLMSAILFTTQ